MSRHLVTHPSPPPRHLRWSARNAKRNCQKSPPLTHSPQAPALSRKVLARSARTNSWVVLGPVPPRTAFSRIKQSARTANSRRPRTKPSIAMVAHIKKDFVQYAESRSWIPQVT